MKLRILAIAVCLVMLIAPRALAASDFSLAFDVAYNVNEDATAAVIKHIYFTNLTTNAYPTAYYLDIPDDATDISAFDRTGKVPFDLLVQDGIRKARLIFNNIPLGLNSETEITLTYRTKSITATSNNGRIITIPPISSSSDIVDYNATLTFPASWGTPSSIQPQPEPLSAGKPCCVWRQLQEVDSPIVISFTPAPAVAAPAVRAGISSAPLYLYGMLFGLLLFGILFLVSRHRQ